MSPIVYGVLMILGLVGFIASMCLVVYLLWRKPHMEEPLPDGQYRMHFVGHNKQTGAPIYDVTELDDVSVDKDK